GELGLDNPPVDSLLPRRAENTVLGINWRQQIADPLSFELEAALSGYNRDMESDELDLGSPSANQWVGYFFQPRFASEAGLAVRGSLQYRKSAFNIGLNYERIDPGFETMGAYFFNSDWENYTANLGFGAFSGVMRMMGSFGLQRNNLYKLRAETSQRIIGAMNLSIQPKPAWGLDFNYSNYSQDHRPGTIEILDDTLRIASTTHNLGSSLRYSLLNEGAATTFLLNASYQLTDNQNPLNDGFQEVNAFFGSFAVLQAFQNQSTQAQGSINYNQIDVGTVQTTAYGISLGGRQLLLEQKLSFNLNNTINLNKVNGVGDGWTNVLHLGSQYKVNQWNAFGLTFSWLKRNSTTLNPFSEVRGQINYSLTIPPIGGSKKQEQ
ncbi:MAG: hypothetical protein KDC44_11915, partial [Phaeodactylibacter sp.]|nr:hypothetical protein [Phaeodactylibacter sp.]